MSGPRYAIYFAPAPDDPLARFGAATLGYDAETGWDVAQTTPVGIDPRSWRAWTSEPRLYGFHATLKAPFHLASGRTESELITALSDFALRRAGFSFDLRLASIGGFVALVAASAPPALFVLEKDIVEAFEPFRAPLSEKDIARRLAAPLTSRQRGSLDRYGYPYVHEDFRFHMTLTGRLDAGERDIARAAIEDQLLPQPPQPQATISSLALFRQENREARFRIAARASMG